MFNKRTHSVQTFFAQLILTGSLFCVLFGQGTHLHVIALHFGDHFDIHAHVHAHESHGDQPFQAENDPDKHQHEVSTASDIIGTLTTPLQVKPDVKAHAIISLDAEFNSTRREHDASPDLFDLPPPRPAFNQYHTSSFSYRGPPIA